ncbi:hypothetical protein [Simkania sp.]|uniref:hypothetical protein n=1 Tax=Simkania sp. TaxID=34094 RepID=UPI003B518B7F
MQAIRQNLFTTNSALHFVSTLGMGLIPSRFTPITMKECALVGTVASSLATVGQAIAGKDATPLKKTLVTIGAFALTFFSVTKLTPLLNVRFAVQLYPGAILQILAFNALGQVASFAITKFYLTTPWNMTEEQIKALHAKYEKKPELFEKHSPVEQLLLWHRFDQLELSCDSFKDSEPSKEEIKALTDDQIRTLHQCEAYLCEPEDNEALLLRYFALNLAPFTGIEGHIPRVSLKMPETIEDLDGIKDQQFKWYALYFDANQAKLEELSYPLQWALYEKEGAYNYNFNAEYLTKAPEAQIRDLMQESDLSWWVTIDPPEQAALVERAKGHGINVPYPVHPKTAKDVEGLDERAVKAYHQDLHKDLRDEVIIAFNLRFYNLNLPLPNGIGTIDVLKKAKLPLPQIVIALPESVEDVQKLHKNQIPWVYASCSRKFSTLPFKVQEALNLRFKETQNNWYYYFSVQNLTAENVSEATAATINILHDDLTSQLDLWVALDPAVRRALNARLQNDLFTAQAFKAVDTTHLSLDQATRYHTYFSGIGNAMWKQLGEKQAAYNIAFDTHSLAQLAV